jgi:K+-transporting ATPase KdpF subunit
VRAGVTAMELVIAGLVALGLLGYLLWALLRPEDL